MRIYSESSEYVHNVFLSCKRSNSRRTPIRWKRASGIVEGDNHVAGPGVSDPFCPGWNRRSPLSDAWNAAGGDLWSDP